MAFVVRCVLIDQNIAQAASALCVGAAILSHASTTHRNKVRFGPTFSECTPKLNEPWTDLTKLGANSTEKVPTSAEVSKVWPSASSMWRKPSQYLRRNRSRLVASEQHVAEIGQSSVDVDKLSQISAQDQEDPQGKSLNTCLRGARRCPRPSSPPVLPPARPPAHPPNTPSARPSAGPSARKTVCQPDGPTDRRSARPPARPSAHTPERPTDRPPLIDLQWRPGGAALQELPTHEATTT